MMLRASNIARAYTVSGARGSRLKYVCEKWTRATGRWAVPFKEASSSESGNVECGYNDWKRKGVSGSDGEEEC